MVKNRQEALRTLSLQQHSGLFLLIPLPSLLPQESFLQNVTPKELMRVNVLEITPKNGDYLPPSL